jgi:hypothetical protein
MIIQAHGPQESNFVSIDYSKSKLRNSLTSKVDNKQPNHANGTPSSSLVVFEVVNVFGQDNSDDQVAGPHANGTNSQDGLTTQTIDPKDSRDGGDKHDNTDNSGSQQTGCVAAKAELLEDLRGVVKNLPTC